MVAWHCTTVKERSKYSGAEPRSLQYAAAEKKKLTQVGLTVVSLIFYLYFLSFMQTKKDTIFVNLTHVVLSVVETQYLRRF